MKNNSGTLTNISKRAMHPTLAPHQHGATCVEIIRRFEECHQIGFFHRIFGGCNSLKLELNDCLSAEFEQRRRHNAKIAREKRKKFEELWKELETDK
ncbi:hypothetical protein G9A89_012436 [Geosiphon pyriformis]|nr:hypothetical protein G9A89_012436 [Geosiphon pyriformis]